jgi:mycothiol synthase
MSESPPPPSAADERAPGSHALGSLIARALAADGTPPFSDGSLVALAEGTRELVWLEGAAAAIVAPPVRPAEGELSAPRPAEAEFVVDPDARRHGLGTRMLEQLIAAHDELLVWAHGNGPGARALAAAHGLVPVRELLHLRSPVTPIPADKAAVGEIAAATAGWQEPWLELNARAFAGHPEQGAMSRADLDQLTSEPWFDPDDVLLLWHGETLVGSCWLKVEEGQPGEFYAVAVAPEHQGAGLGRLLMAAGFARLGERGIREATLYVEADNTAALRLYRGFGFREHSIDVQYRYVKVVS